MVQSTIVVQNGTIKFHVSKLSPPKFSIAPEKLGSSSKHPFFGGGELLNFDWV